MLYTLNSKLNYKIRYFQADSEEPEISVGVSPDFDGYNREGDECTVFDFLALVKKMDSNVSYYPITCECGMPDDAGIDAPLLQAVTNDEIWWDIPIEEYRWTISPEYRECKGTLRIIFNKQHFQQTVLQMYAELQALVENGIEISQIKPEDFINLYHGIYCLEQAVANNPQITHATLEKIHPYGGTEAAKLFID